MAQSTVLFLCPLGQQHRDWRVEAAPKNINVIMRRSTEVSRAELLGMLTQADALITERTGVIDAEMIEAGKKLKLIQRLGSLYHDIDLEAAKAHKIPVCSQPILGTIAVAEHMMAQMLGLIRRVLPLQSTIRRPPESFRTTQKLNVNDKPIDVAFTPRRTSEDVFAFNWSEETQVGVLYGKTIGILGFGEIGAELARRLRGWGCNVVYNKRQRLAETVERDLGIVYSEPDALLRQSDVVVSLMPYFKETDMWLNAERLATMKPGAFLCHSGSGSVIDEAAVTKAVQNGALRGAAFDTYEWEPIKASNPLLTLIKNNPKANVLLTPHVGSCNDAPADGFKSYYNNVVAALSGQPIFGRVA